MTFSSRLAAACVFAFCLISSTFAKDQRNVLLMIGDDHGLYGGCFGNPVVATPSLDRLAASGTNFTNAFAAVSSCSPSRSVILSGLYNHTNGQYGLQHATNNQVTEPWVRTLPRVFNDAGYRTMLIGKNHVGPQEIYPYQEHKEVSRDPKEIAGVADKFFSNSDDRPFLLVIGFHDPHRAKKDFDTGPGSSEGIKIPEFLPDDPKVRDDVADYCRAVARLDAGVGLVLDALEKSKKSEETLVLYVGDNGMPFTGAKTNLYDPGIHLPMLIRAPGAAGGSKNPSMVSFIDLTPTILDWAKLKSPYPLPGRSLLPLLQTAEADKNETVFASHTVHEIWMYYPMRMIRTRRYKLIWNLAHTLEYPIAGDMAISPTWEVAKNKPAQNGKTAQQYLHRPRYELFDLESDPQELKNLADDPKLVTVKSELLARLKQMMKETKDPWLGRPPVENAE